MRFVCIICIPEFIFTLMKTYFQFKAHIFLTGFLFLVSSQSTSGQTIRGKVQETDGRSLPYVNLLLIHPDNSTLVKGAVSDSSGVYLMDNVPSGTYLLAARMVEC